MVSRRIWGCRPALSSCRVYLYPVFDVRLVEAEPFANGHNRLKHGLPDRAAKEGLDHPTCKVLGREATGGGGYIPLKNEWLFDHVDAKSFQQFPGRWVGSRLL